jgi:hypothetical protein
MLSFGGMNRYRTALAVLITLALAPGVAQARTTRVARPPLPRPMPEIIHAGCPGFEEAMGCFVPAGDADATGRGWDRGAVFTDGYRFTTMHELGHAYDATLMDDGERNRFARLVGRGDEFWVTTYHDEEGRVIDAGSSLSEVFADAYANCALGHIIASGHVWESGAGYYPTASEHRQVCGLIARAGRRASVSRPVPSPRSA